METENLLSQFKNNEFDFRNLVDRFKSIKDDRNSPCLYRLFWNRELFEELIKNNRLNKEDLKYLLNTVDKGYELDELCCNTSLIKFILNEFVLNKELVDKLNAILEKIRWCKSKNIHTTFELIEYYHKDNEEVLKLNELNEKICLLNIFNLNKDQKLELIEILRSNESARNRLIQIIDNHLENTYDFDSLMNYLKKSEKKSILNI